MANLNLIKPLQVLKYGFLKPGIISSSVLVAALASVLSSSLFAQGDLLITPRRVVFEGSKRSMDLNLANTGKDTATYAISLIQIRMKEDGGFETITEPDSGQRFSDRYIRFFPRSVTLGPGEAQTIKVQLIRTNELTEGEYRSHFYFRSVPQIKPLGEEGKPADSTNISVKLIPVFGITIPAIVRVGQSNAKVTLSDLSFKAEMDTIPVLDMVLRRTGNMSVYGDITVDHISPQGIINRVGVANGVAVYTPNSSRSIKLYLMNVPGVEFNTGKLKVTYSASSDVKPAVLAQGELILK